MIPAIQEIGFGPGTDKAYATLHQATVSFAEMGERTISTQVRIDGDVVPDFDGWEVSFKGERFILNTKDPQAVKDNSTRNSLVDLTFVSWVVNELKRYFFFEPTSIDAGTAIADKYKASVNVPVEDFAVLFNKVLDYYFDGKVVFSLYMSGQGQYSTDRALVEIDYTYIWDVLVKFFEIYGVRWRIEYDSTNDVYTIKAGWPTTDIDINDHDFEYGYKGGLLRFERQVQDVDIHNILLGRGGEKNIPYRYFKRVDPQNPDWAADPDAIPELSNIYFDRLRDINFRWYVRGWMQNPNHDTSWEEGGYVYPTYTIASDSPYYFAYQKGLTDEKFNPVEYVKDDESIADYGEHWGALDDNDDIFPTIQGVTRAPLGRIDEAVAVSEIVTDDIEAMAQNAAIEKSINRLTISLDGETETVFDRLSEEFTIPSGSTGNVAYVPVGTDEVNPGLVRFDTDNSTVFAVADGVEYPIDAIPAGTYRLKLHMVIARSGQATSATGTFGIENIILTTSSMDTDAWKPTFDIWVKNIWGTTKGQDENDIQYAERVWLPILGDRAGNEAKIVFSSGFMSVSEDYEFTIVSYPVYDTSKSINGVPSEWRITLRKSDAEFDATGLYIPNASTGGQPIAGDKFFFIGIDMPFRYVELAEEDLNTNKEAQLDTEAAISPTWIMNLDKVRVHTLEDQEYGRTLADRLAAGGKVWIKDKRFTPGQRLQLYVQSITYTWNEPSDDSPYIVPDIEVVLSDKVVAVDSIVQRIQSDVSSIKNQYARISDVEAVVRSVAEPIFLKKTGESDSSDSPTQFSSKVTSKGFRQGAIGGKGWGIYRDNTSAFAADENENDQSVQTRGTRSLRALRANASEQEEEADAVIEADRIVVRKELQVNSLVINQIAYVGGKEIISAAKIEVSKVIETANGYICYFDQRRNSVANNFAVNDIAFGQVFNPDNSEQRYYKMVVTATDVDCITLGKSQKDGSGVPKVGDIIVQYGNTTNVDRQYVIVRDVIGGGYERMLSGLNSVSSTGKEYYFAGRQNNSGARWFVGDSLGDYAEYEDGVLTIKANVIFKAGQEIPGLSELSGEVSELSGDVDAMSQELIAFNQALGGLTTDVDALEYLKTALPKSDTIISGGLILSKVIALRDSNNVIKSGINGDPTLSNIAAWYGGPMADKEATPTPASYAQTLFRFDGSGYLAGGNIFWNNQGYGGIPGVTWSRINGQDVVSIGANVQLESLQGADSSVTDLIDAVNSLADLFEVVNGNVHVKNNRGFYSDSFISAGGLSDSGGTAGGNASMQLISGGGRITNGTDTLDVYSMSRVDQLLASAGTVQTVAGVSPSNGDIPVASLQTALSLGAAAYKAVGSVASGNTGLVTGGDVYSAINEAVSSVLKMQGTTTTAVSDGSTTNPVTINGSSYTAKKGDVVMYGNKEFWWTGSAWEELGDEASWALKTTTISAGTGLTGGGTLASNRTISLSDSTIASLALADTALQSHQTIYALTIKNSAGTTQLTYTPNVEAGSITLTKAMVGLGNVDNLAASGYFTLLENSSNQISLTIGGTNKKLTVAYATKALQDSAGNQISTYYLPKATFDDMFEKVALSGGGYAIKAKYGLYTDQFLSAGGLSTGGGAAGGDTSMVVSGNVATFTSSSATFQTYSKTYIDNAISGAGSVSSIKLGTVEYTPDSNKVVNLPAYPTSLPASDVSAWAKASTKPSYAFSEITGTASTSQIPTLAISKISGLQTALDGKQPLDADLTAIAGLTGTSGFLKKTAANTWALDTNTYLTTSSAASTYVSGVALNGNYLRVTKNGANTDLTIPYATNADTLDGFHAASFDGAYKTTIDATALNEDTWYPVVMNLNSYVARQTKIRIEGRTATTGSWNSRSDKMMAVVLDYTVQGSGWGWVTPTRFISHFTQGAGATGNPTIGGLGQLTNSSIEFVFVRGGAKYDFYLNFNITPEIKTSTYTVNSQSVAPTTTAPTAISRNVALVSDNVASATKLQTARTIWGQSFDGQANVSGAMTGVTTITASGQAEVGSLKLANAVPTLTWDSHNNAWHLSGNFYADGFISAGGVSSGGGTAGVDLPAVWTSLRNVTTTASEINSTIKIAEAHIPDMASTYGYLKSAPVTSVAGYTGAVTAAQISSAIGLSGYVTLAGAETISGLKTFTSGLRVSGRVYSAGDDEGIVITWAINNYASLVLGSHNAERSVFTIHSGDVPKWVYNNGTTGYAIMHPAKAGTIALTSDIPNVPSWALNSTKPSYTFAEITDKITHTNEFNFIPNSFDGYVYFNYRGSGEGTANISKYIFHDGSAVSAGRASVEASSFIKYGGTSSQFLKADGSVDNSTYLTSVAFSNLTSHPTNLSGYGITDAIQYNNNITNLAATGQMGYGYTTSGWYTAGPAMSFGASNYTAQIQSSASGNTLYYRQTVNGTAQSWVNILHTGNYTSYALPRSGGSSYPMTGQLYVQTGTGISDASGNGLLVYHPASWTGASNTQWAVGAVDSQGVIRSSATDLIHYKGGTNYVVLDASNYSSYALPLTGGTICSYTSYARLRFVTNATAAYIQAGTSDANSGNLYLSALNGGVGTNLYLKFSNIYATGANYTVYHSGNSNKSNVAWACSTLTANGYVYANRLSNAVASFVMNKAGSYWSGIGYDGTSNVTRFGPCDGTGVWTASPTVTDTWKFIGNVVATGAITAGSASDARLKTNIQSLSAESAKRIVMALNPVTFTWNEKAGELFDQYKGDDLGMIAQEVEPYLPQAVGTIFENYKRLDYTKVISPLVKVAQDHETRLEKLEKEVKARDAKIVELESEIKRLRMN